jgi:HAE1 family hydrophobic/amphiphilic exporter-1
LRLDLYPDISFPVVLTIIEYSGANPNDIETLISRPIEEAVAAVDGVESIKSESKQGISLVTIEFDWGCDMEQAETDVRRAIEMVKGFLPEDSKAPIIFAFDPSLQPIVMMTVSGPYPLDELRNIADDEISPLLERLDGIASAEAAGGLKRQIHVTLDPAKIEAYKLDVSAVMGAVYLGNSQQPGGYVEQGSLEFDIQTLGKYTSVEEIGQVVVGARVTAVGQMQPIQLKEVASVEDGFIEPRRILETDGKSSIWMIVRKQSGANTVQSAEKVVAVLEKIPAQIGRDIEFKTIFNQADYINSSIGTLSGTAVQGVIITFFVLLFFLYNIRSSLIVTMAIPLSVIATFAVMDQAGMTLNVLSLAGLALAVGMLVDNSIVVLENIFRLRQLGMSAWDASIKGASTVGLAVTASTLTTIVVFVPVLFVPGIAGVMFKDLAITICFALTVSLVVALTFIPLSASRLLSGPRAERLLARANIKQEKNLGGMYKAYGRALDWSLAHRWAVVLTVVGMLAVTGAMFTVMPTEFIHSDDDSFLYISVEAPVGTALNETYKTLKDVEKKIAEIIPPEDRKLIAVDAGVGEGFTAIMSKGIHAGSIRVPLVSPDDRKTSLQQYQDKLREALKGFPGVKVTVGNPFNFMGGEGDVEIQMRGYDLDLQRETGLALQEALKDIPDLGETVFSMSVQKPQMEVKFDRQKLAALGLSSGNISQAVSIAFQGRTVARYSDGGDEFDIFLRYGEAYRKDSNFLTSMPVMTPTGGTVPLGNIADVDARLGPVDITRLDQERYTKLNIYLKETWTDESGAVHKKDMGSAIAKITAVIEKNDLPDGFSYKVAGSAEDFQKSFKYLGYALAVSVILVFMVMASQFESLREPFIIMFTVPLAGIGVIIMFAITQTAIDISALIGIIMLVGIVVNNGIIMVDAANQIREEQPGCGRTDCIALAGRQRLRPVLMTSLTTILGMVPMALGFGEGASSWAGMAKAVIGGLTTATFMTLFVVPIMYTVFARKSLKRETKVFTANE